MRSLADVDRIRRFMRALGQESRAAGRVYFTGGSSAVLLGWRASTIDVDLKLVPEHDRLLRAIPRLKESLSINVELASPDDFIPVRDGWTGRSPFIAQEGKISFHHFDFESQALAKIERGHAQDIADVHEILRRKLVTPEDLRQGFAIIEQELYRYPAIDPPTFSRAVEEVLKGSGLES